MPWGYVTSSFSVITVVSYGPLASGAIYIFSPGVKISKSKYKSTSKYSTPGVFMSGSYNTGIAMSSFLIPNPGIKMPMSVSISENVSAFHSSSTAVLKLTLIGSSLSSLVRGFGDRSSNVRS